MAAGIMIVILALRSILLLAFFYSWLISMAILCSPLLLLPRHYARTVTQLWIRVYLSAVKHIAGLHWQVRGTEHLPAQGGYIIACKHQSAWETFFLMLLLPDPAIILKKQLLAIPFYGWYARKMKHIPIDRKGGAKALRAMLKIAAQRMALGRQLIIFPQGTRVPPGALTDQYPYQSGIAALYEHLKVPVVPAALNSGLFWRKGELSARPGLITLEFLPPIAPGLDRRHFMAALETSIESQSAVLLKAANPAAVSA